MWSMMIARAHLLANVDEGTAARLASIDEETAARLASIDEGTAARLLLTSPLGRWDTAW
jgi:hypothetical protein